MAAGCITDHHEGVSLRGHLVYEKEMDSRGINESSKSKKICGLDKDPGTRAFNPACDTEGAESGSVQPATSAVLEAEQVLTRR